MDYVELCKSFIEQEFPTAEIAVIGGSTARGTRTASSDVDLLIIGDGVFTDGRSSLAATYSYGGEVFEVFAYSHDAYSEWARRGIERHRPVIVHMLVEGREVRGGAALDVMRDRWRATLAEGPSVSGHDLAVRRYAITDLVDDLRDASDELEQSAVAWTLFEKLGELMLLTDRRWIGTGKYLPRRLRELSRARTEKLTSPLLRGDFRTFADRVDEELMMAGGRVRVGFIR